MDRCRKSGARAQISIEFLFSAGIVLVLLALSTLVYYANTEESARMRDSLEANRICMQAASAIGAAAAVPSGANSTVRLSLPPTIGGQNYTIYVSSAKNTVKIDYASTGIGCQFPKANITNSSGATLFTMARNASIQSTGGAVIVR